MIAGSSKDCANRISGYLFLNGNGAIDCKHLLEVIFDFNITIVINFRIVNNSDSI